MTMKSVNPAFQSSDVAAVFMAYPPDLMASLLRLRALIFDTAATTDGVGTLTETLKWGQPSYCTTEPKCGTSIRIDAVRSAPDRFALFVHCQTDLIPTFRQLYPDALTCEGNRAVVFRRGEQLPEEVLRHCIALALTYHRRKARKDR